MRDYKPRPPGVGRNLAGRPLLGVVIGLVLGLTVASCVQIYLASASTEPSSGTDGRKPSASPAERPQFDFYRILPAPGEPVTERERRAGASPRPRHVVSSVARPVRAPGEIAADRGTLARIGMNASLVRIKH